MRQNALLFIILKCLLCVQVLCADDMPVLTRESARQIAVQNNPALRVAEVEIARAESRLKWAGRLSNPELELSASDDFLGNDEGEGSFEVGFTQHFPVTARLRQEKVVHKYLLQQARLEFQTRQHELAREVDEAWITALIASQRVPVQARLAEINGELVIFLRERAELGEFSQLEVTQAHLTGKLLEQRLGQLRAEAQLAEAALKKLLGFPSERLINLPEQLPSAETPVMEIPLEIVLNRRPEFLVMALQNELSEAQMALALSGRWEDLGVNLFVERERAAEGAGGVERNTMVGIGLTIPLPLWNRNEQALDDVQLERERAQRALQAAVFELESQLNSALTARAMAHALAVEVRRELPQLARKNLADVTAAQRSGQATLQQVQQAQEQLIEFESATLDAFQEYLLADSRVRFLTGDFLEQ